jgi:hypothetical protein
MVGQWRREPMATRGEDDIATHTRYHGHRKHRGELCRQCFHYRWLSEKEEACDAYERWLTYPTTKRALCEQYVSR